MELITLTVRNKSGLHARPAAAFVQAAKGFKAIIRMSKDGREVDAKSILSVLTLNVNAGSAITLRATGDDEQQAIAALKKLIESGLGEAA